MWHTRFPFTAGARHGILVRFDVAEHLGACRMSSSLLGRFSRSMRLSLTFVRPPPAGIYVADDRLATRIHMHMLDDDVLLPG